MKPTVGVLPLWDEDKNSIWMLPGYMDGLLSAGALPVILPFSTENSDLERIFEICDGFLFTGGQDVSPALYNEIPIDGINCICEKRDILEIEIFRRAFALDKPILGICRGIQLINVAMGGTLYQDLHLQYPSDIIHRQSPPYDIPSHTVTIEERCPLFNCLGINSADVNSSHHQAIKNLAPGLKAMAYSADGIIEAVYSPDRTFLWAVQWHPERLYNKDENNKKIFNAFVRSML